jgi:hypothetical protein
MTIPALLRGWGLGCSLICAAAALLSLSPRSAQAAVDPERAKIYRDLAATINPRALQDTIRELSVNPDGSPVSRVVGYPGERRAADYVQRELAALFGPNVQEQNWTATVPMDRGATLTANGRTYQLYSLWPNLVRTSQTPPEGISGPLIYAGNGQLSAFNGKDVRGSIVLVDLTVGRSG